MAGSSKQQRAVLQGTARMALLCALCLVDSVSGLRVFLSGAEAEGDTNGVVHFVEQSLNAGNVLASFKYNAGNAESELNFIRDTVIPGKSADSILLIRPVSKDNDAAVQLAVSQGASLRVSRFVRAVASAPLTITLSRACVGSPSSCFTCCRKPLRFQFSSWRQGRVPWAVSVSTRSLVTGWDCVDEMPCSHFPFSLIMRQLCCLPTTRKLGKTWPKSSA